MKPSADRVAARYLKAGKWDQRSYLSVGDKHIIVTLRATSPRPGVTVPFNEAEKAWKDVYQAGKRLAADLGGKITAPVEILGVPKPALQVPVRLDTQDFMAGEARLVDYLTKLGFRVRGTKG